MTVREERELRNTAKKLMECESRTKLIKELIRKGLGLREVEEFVSKEAARLRKGGKGKGNNEYLRKGNNKHRGIVTKLMKEKLRDSQIDGVDLRRTKASWLSKLQTRLNNRREFDKVKGDVKVQCEKVKAKLEKKNAKKVKWLNDMYGKEEFKYEGLLKSCEIEKYGNCRIFKKGELKCEVAPSKVMIVGSRDEVIKVPGIRD